MSIRSYFGWGLSYLSRKCAPEMRLSPQGCIALSVAEPSRSLPADIGPFNRDLALLFDSFRGYFVLLKAADPGFTLTPPLKVVTPGL